MQRSEHRMCFFLLLAVIFGSGNMQASNGYFPNGTGTANKAMAGAGMAMPEEAISVVNNPAVAAFLDEKTDVGVSFFMPDRNYTTLFGGLDGRLNAFSIENGDVDSDKDLFVIPEIARTRQLSNQSAFAWAFYMRSGISTSFPGGSATFDPDGNGPLGITTRPGTFGDQTAGLELSQAYVDVAWAKKLGENTSLGVSLVLAAQSLKARGIGGFSKYTETFAVTDGADLPGHLSGNGQEIAYGAGLKIGLHRLLGDHFRLGIMYQTEINIGSYGDYSDLLADGGDMDIPAWFRVGLTWQPVDRFSLSIDAQKIWYSKIDALGNSFENIYACPSSGLGGTDLSRCLGGRNGPGFGWRDVPVISFGASWEVSDRWTLRAGISGSDQPAPIPETTFNILMVSVTEVHYTAGLSHRLNNGHTLGFSFMYTEEESIETLNQLDPSQVIVLTASQFDFQFSYSWGR